MRWLAVAVPFLFLAGCGGSAAGPVVLPSDFTVTQSAAVGQALPTYTINVTGPTHINATLVWTNDANRLDLQVTAGGSSGGTGVAAGTVSRLEQDLYKATYFLKVTGTVQKADTWRIEVHFTQKR